MSNEAQDEDAPQAWSKKTSLWVAQDCEYAAAD